jgi:hypothetical protein
MVVLAFLSRSVSLSQTHSHLQGRTGSLATPSASTNVEDRERGDFLWYRFSILFEWELLYPPPQKTFIAVGS